MNAIGGIWNLVSPVFDGDGVTARHVRHVRHRVRSVPVVSNVGLLWLSLWILELAHKHDLVVMPPTELAKPTKLETVLQKRIINLINVHVIMPACCDPSVILDHVVGNDFSSSLKDILASQQSFFQEKAFKSQVFCGLVWQRRRDFWP